MKRTSGRCEQGSRRLPAKSHLSVATNRAQVNGSFEFGQRTEMPCFDSDREFVSSSGPRIDDRSDRLAIAAWLRITQDVDMKAQFRREESPCRSPAGYAAQIIPQFRSARTAPSDLIFTTSAMKSSLFRLRVMPPESPSSLITKAVFRRQNFIGRRAVEPMG